MVPMAGIQRSSFQKRGSVKGNFIKGTSPSLHNSQLLISSGIPSFDSLIGGGLPVGSLLLINEDEYGTYAKIMLRYFLAEGIVSQHALLLASEDINLEEMVQGLPLPVDTEVKELDENGRAEKKMTIAWRYENLKTSSYERYKHFGHYFDLSKTMHPELINNSDITFFYGEEVTSGKSFQESIYLNLLKSVQKKLEEGLYFANQANTERKILRIVLFHINSPMWHCDENSDSEKHFLRFLFSLRALIRNAYATCFFTVPYSMHKKDLMNKCIHLADIALQLQSFAGTGCENVPPFKDYHGLFLIQKLAAINTLVSYISPAKNLAFKLQRKKLIIELSGICLVLLGCLLVHDAPRILLSQLVVEPGVIPQPLLYYAALAFIALGLIVCGVALLGSWASCALESNWLLGTYMFLLIVLLLAEISFGAVASLCPQIIGVILDRDQMVTGLMNNYGVPGRSQYTAAVDLAQTLFECCGMQSGSDYDGSRWWKREQDTMHDLRVPHSCCFLSNTDEENSFLDPKPINSSLCQAKTNSRYQYGRHVKGCIDKLNAWFKEHITIFLIIGLALVVVQLAVLLCAILVSLRKRKPPQPVEETSSPMQFSSLRKQKRTEKNLTPKPERKNTSAQCDNQQDSSFSVGQSHDNSDFYTTLKSLKTPKTQDFSEEHGSDSFSSLPLVLRNDYYWKYDDYKNKSNANSARRLHSPFMQEMMHYNQGSNVYFTPQYRSTGKREDKVPSNKVNDYKSNGELKNYFIKTENCEVDKSKYDVDWNS